MYSRFDRLADPPRDENGEILKKYDNIQPDGLGGPGERLDPGDIYVNKQSPMETKELAIDPSKMTYKNAPMSYKSPIQVCLLLYMTIVWIAQWHD